MTRRTAIITGLRTPFVRSGTVFKNLTALDLGVLAVRELMDRSGVRGEDVDHLVYGTVVHDPHAPNIAREVGLATLPKTVPAVTVSRTVAPAHPATPDPAQPPAPGPPEPVTMLCPASPVFPGQALVLRLLEAGELGEVRLVRLHQLAEAALSPEAPFHWRMDREVSGYNVLTLGMFAEILHRWVGKARTVCATGRIFTTQRPDPDSGEPRTVRIPESLAVSGELENGAHYVYTFSSVAARAPKDAIEIYGARGALIYQLGSHTVRMASVEPRTDLRVGRVAEKEALPGVEVPAAERGEWRLEADFAAAIREGAPVFPDFQHGVDYMEFVEAAGRSLETGKTITLPLE